MQLHFFPCMNCALKLFEQRVEVDVAKVVSNCMCTRDYMVRLHKDCYWLFYNKTRCFITLSTTIIVKFNMTTAYGKHLTCNMLKSTFSARVISYMNSQSFSDFLLALLEK